MSNLQYEKNRNDHVLQERKNNDHPLHWKKDTNGEVCLLLLLFCALCSTQRDA